MSLPEAPPAVLPQDQAQASQAQSIVNEQQYQKEVIQYGKDKEVYDKEKAAYDLQVKTIKDAESAEKKRIDDIRIAAEKEVEKRAAGFKDIEDRYAAMKNPYTYRAGHKGASYNNDGWVNWQTNYQKSKKAEIDALKYEHVVADGFKPASINRGGHIPAPPRNSYAAKFYTGEAINQSASQALQSGISSINIGNRWTRYQVEISRANAAVYAGGSLSVHAGAVQAAKNAFDGLEKQEQLKFSAAAQKESVNQQINDSKHWNEVINNPNTSKDLQKTNQVILEKQGLNIDVKALDASGVSSIYNILDMSKSGSLPSSASVTINTKKYSISNQPDNIIIPTRTNTSGNKGVNESNISQKQYVNDLRTGKVGLAQALLYPQTPQSYSTGNTINLKQFLVERGYNINRPETIPDSVLTTPVKYDAARKQASYAEKTNTTMGDLRGFIPNQPKVSDSTLQSRQNALSFNASKVSKGGSYIGYGIDGTPVQGAPTPNPNGKIQWSVESGKTKNVTLFRLDGSSYVAREKSDPVLFDTKEQAQSYIDYQNKTNPYLISQGYSKQGDTPLVTHTMFGKHITDKNTIKVLGNIKRSVDTALSPITNIGIEINNLITGEKKKLQPTVISSAIGDTIGGVFESVKQGTLNPKLEKQPLQNAYDFILKDPLGAVSQIPAEVLLFRVGGQVASTTKNVAVRIGTSIFERLPTTTQTVLSTTQKTISGIIVKVTSPITDSLPRYAKANELKFYQGITIRNKPIIGISQGKIVYGTPKPETIPLGIINLKSRSQGELALGFGAEKNIFYSEKAIQYYQKSGFINELSAARIKSAISSQMATKNQGSIYTGALGKDPAKTISDKQFKSLLKTAETEFKAGKIEPVHGSLSTRTHMESNLRKRGGDILRMGDLDISPKYSSKLGATGFEKEASRIIQKAGSAFPKIKGEKLEIVDKIGQSRSLLFTPKDSTKQVKIFEVLVKDKQSSAGRIKGEPNFIMGEKIPTNTVMVVGTKLETSTLRYQGLTNLKTKTAFQEYKPSGYSLSPRIIGKDIVSVKDTMTKAMVYVGEGREKDIVRSYYITLQTSQNQARAGMIKAAAESAREAQEMKNLYPHLKFEQGFTDRVKIDFDIGVGTSSVKSKIVESTIPRMMIPQSISTEPNIESTVLQKTDFIKSPNISKLLVKSDRSKLLVKSDRSRLFQKTNTVSKSFSESVKVQSPSVKVQSPSVKVQSPSVKVQSPSVKVQSPSVKVQSPPSMKIQSPPSMKIQSPPLSPNITTKKVYPPIIPTQKAATLLPDFKRGYPIKEKTKNYPKKDFLGNTRLDNIVGLFRRNTIIVGDKKVSKQLGKDKRYGKKKDRVDRQSGNLSTLFVGKKGKLKL